MKRICLLLYLALSISLLIGCIPIEPFAEDSVKLLSVDGVFGMLLINGIPLGYDANVQPGDLIRIDFNSGRDQYGNKTGLSSSRYTIEMVTAKCDLKPKFDTVFTTSDDNVIVWFPGYTAPLEAISGLPVPFYPLEGYPWNSCRDTGIPDMASQQATITATARANWIEVEFVLTEQDGTYTLDLPGHSATSENTIAIRIIESGSYTVTHSGGKVHEFYVPEDWFWITGSWIIEVGPTGTCG